ncbi:unnamed protein product, partial [marine sediment metagenome]
HSSIGTEHILLGLTREEEGVAAKVLTNLGAGLNKVRSAVEFIVGHGERPGTGETGLKITTKIYSNILPTIRKDSHTPLTTFETSDSV